MRQKDDLTFATALTNLALGVTTEAENKIFKSRELSSLNLTSSEVMNMGAVALYYTNKDVDTCNAVMLGNLPGEAHVSIAYDQFLGKNSIEQKTQIFEIFKLGHHSKTQGLMTKLVLKIGGKYVLSSNIEVIDGLTNGAPCILRHIAWGELQSDKSIVPLRLYVEFEHVSMGENMRLSLRDKIVNDKITEKNWTPIERCVKILSVSGGSTAKICRNQFPLKPAFAMTIHTAQGTTQNKALIKLKGLSRREKYTALSRVRCANDLYIDGVFEPPSKANQSKDLVLMEMKRLREKRPYNFSICYPENEEKYIKVISHNIRSLVKYLEYLKTDFNYCNCDIIMLTETRTKETSLVSVPGYSEICRDNAAETSNYNYGMIIYAKDYLQPYINVLYNRFHFSKSDQNVFLCTYYRFACTIPFGECWYNINI